MKLEGRQNWTPITPPQGVSFPRRNTVPLGQVLRVLIIARQLRQSHRDDPARQCVDLYKPLQFVDAR